METLWKDLRFGVRTLAKSPGFAAVAVLTLALGVGATTAIFSVVNALLLRPLPFKDLDRLVAVWEAVPAQGVERNEISEPNYLDWRAQSSSFEHLAVYSWWSVNVSGVETPERVQGFQVSPNFFDALGARAALGRTFLPEEEQPGKDRVVILSDGYWRSRFAADPAIVGKTLTLNGIGRTVVGVMPKGFDYPTGGEMWSPYRFDPANTSPRYAHFLLGVGRLRAGVTREQAEAELGGVAARLEQQYPETNAGRRVAVRPLLADTVRQYRPMLLLMLAAVGFVLLIACANVANLLLARAASRSREMAIRAALGAGRLRILRQLLTESLMLALAGGGLGVLLAVWGVDLIAALFPSDFVRYIPGWGQIGVDRRALLFTLAVSLAAGVLFGLAPALRASRADLNDALKEGGKAGGAERNRLRSLLVVAEVALSLVLLAGAGLMLRSFVRLLEVKPGFDPERVLVAELILPRARYREDAQAVEFYSRLREGVGGLPGVRSAALTSFIPLAGSNATTGFTVEGQPRPPHGQEPEANYRAVTPGYFSTMRIPLVGGRAFDEGDAAGAERVCVVNEALARKYFPGEDPLGRYVRGEGGTPEAQLKRIVGVVGDVRHNLDEDPKPEIYFPEAQDASRSMVLVARADADPLSLAPAVRAQVQALDRDLPVYNVRTMDQVRAESIFRQRFSVVLLGIFAALALALASVGLYGVISYTVTQRTHEIGVRMALGAQGGDVLRMVVRQGMAHVAVGVGAGLAGSLLLTRVMAGLLYGVSATDPATFAGVSLLLAAVALAACLVPARRAAKVDPIKALRYE